MGAGNLYSGPLQFGLNCDRKGSHGAGNDTSRKCGPSRCPCCRPSFVPEKYLKFKDPRGVSDKFQLGIFVEKLLFSTAEQEIADQTHMPLFSSITIGIKDCNKMFLK